MTDLKATVGARLTKRRVDDIQAFLAGVIADLEPLAPLLREKELEIAVERRHDWVYLSFENKKEKTVSAVSIEFDAPQSGRLKSATWRRATLQVDVARPMPVGDNGMVYDYPNRGTLYEEPLKGVGLDEILELVGDLIQDRAVLLADYSDPRFCHDEQFALAYKPLKSLVDKAFGGALIAQRDDFERNSHHTYLFTDTDGQEVRLRYDGRWNVTLSIGGKDIANANDDTDEVLALIEQHYGLKRSRSAATA